MNKTIVRWQSGVSLIDLSKELGMSVESLVEQFIIVLGIGVVRDGIVQDLTIANYSPTEISKVSGIPLTTVYKVVERLGVTPGHVTHERLMLQEIVKLMDTGINVKGTALALGIKESRVRTILLNAGFLPADFLTKVEYDVYSLVEGGLTQVEAAAELGLTAGYLNRVYKRALAKNRPESRVRVDKVKNGEIGI